MGERVVVIGGSGFMGSHTADALSDRGFAVTVVDRVRSPWLRSDQDMCVGDVLDQTFLNRVIEGAKYVYHFAGIADIAEAKSKPYETIELNIMGTTAAVEASVRNNIDRFVYASTMYVYSPFGSFYRASKQASELIIEAFHEKYGLGYTFLRYGSLYGPRAQPWNGLRRYVSQVIREGQLVYRGTGKERREYIHVHDAARLSVDILDDAHKNQAITVTGQQILSSTELLDMVFEIAGKEKKVVFSTTDMSQDHYAMTPYRYTPSRAKKLVPSEFIDIGQGILELIEEISRSESD